MGSGIRNVSNPDGGSSLVNLRVALLEVTLKPSAKFSFFDSRFFRNGSMLIEQISATSITCDPWLLLNPWMWGKNHIRCRIELHGTAPICDCRWKPFKTATTSAVAPCHRHSVLGSQRRKPRIARPPRPPGENEASRASAHGEHGLSHHWNDTLPVDTPG